MRFRAHKNAPFDFMLQISAKIIALLLIGSMPDSFKKKNIFFSSVLPLSFQDQDYDLLEKFLPKVIYVNFKLFYATLK